jgi:hypothetical protein
VAPNINTHLNSREFFHVVFCSSYSITLGVGDQLLLSSVLGHSTQCAFSSTWHHKFKRFCFLAIIFKWDMKYETDWETIGLWLNSSWHHFTVKQWHVAGSYTLFDISTFQTIALILSIMTQTMTMENKTYFWHAIRCFLIILDPYWTSDCGQNDSAFQEKDKIQTVHTQ